MQGYSYLLPSQPRILLRKTSPSLPCPLGASTANVLPAKTRQEPHRPHLCSSWWGAVLQEGRVPRSVVCAKSFTLAAASGGHRQHSHLNSRLHSPLWKHGGGDGNRGNPLGCCYQSMQFPGAAQRGDNGQRTWEQGEDALEKESTCLVWPVVFFPPAVCHICSRS